MLFLSHSPTFQHFFEKTLETFNLYLIIFKISLREIFNFSWKKFGIRYYISSISNLSWQNLILLRRPISQI